MAEDKNKSNTYPPSELRRDLISGDWVVIAMGRGKRPGSGLFKRASDPAYEKKEGCPFENLEASGNPPPIFALTKSEASSSSDWFVQVIPNKYPAFGGTARGMKEKVGPFEVKDGTGFHEVIITRDHNRTIAQFSQDETILLLRAYRMRYHLLSHQEDVKYISIFHNYGREAGASLFHPHSQLMAIPVVPPDVARSFHGSLRYFENHGRCVHCDLLAWERKEKIRVIYENSYFVALCPFVSHTAFEVRIFPKSHESSFEEIGEEELADAADILHESLHRLWGGLGDPAYNFFIHTSPAGTSTYYPHYHWHIEILPKTGTPAGFEISTGIDISTITPEVAADALRKVV